jgi:serine/threonine protein kinase
MTERSVFLALLEMDDQAQRSAYLEQACAGMPDLRAQIERLLAAHDGPGNFMDVPAADLVDVAGSAQQLSEGPGTIIGSYKLLERIGEGGFAVVFMAEQQQPVRRKVAIKVLKAGMDTRQVVARFEAERQVLALMDHPNIARVLDGGETASGRHYFVMELVHGIPVTDFCNRNQLDVMRRLDLFLAVCRGVQHAHQKGIIHRDLKPSNLLVTMHDSTPVVKVIDFGIAKAIGQQLTEKTLFTNFAQMLGTPTYMSPEQTQMSGLDIDTRTDVYSLGVLLYELLTGTTPFERDRISMLAYDEIRRIILEEEPPRPSTRMNARTATLPAGMLQQPGDWKRVSRICSGDLDWIVMKSLEKDRARRYESVGALASDVEHYLRDEPVRACPPSQWYRFRKLARRNKPVFIVAAAFAAAVVLTVAGLAVSNIRISREQARTNDERNRADQAQKLAEKRAADVLSGLERLKTANNLLDRARWCAANLRLDDAQLALTKAAALRPDNAVVWSELSDLHTRLGLWDAAAGDYAREFEVHEPDSTERWYQHALLYLSQDDVAGYLEVRRRMQVHFRGTANPFFMIELVRTSALSPAVDPEIERMVRLAEELLPGHSWEWYHPYITGLAYYRAGRYDDAVDKLRTSLAADENLIVRALSFPVLAMVQHRLGHASEARQALADADAEIERWTKDVYENAGDRHWVHHLGAGAPRPVAWWDWVEFRVLHREAKLLIEAIAPPPDPRLHVLRARAYAGLREHVQADAEYAQALQDLGEAPQVWYESHRNRGYLHVVADRWAAAAAEFNRAAELRPAEFRLWFFQAVAHAAAGEDAAYRRVCDQMLARFEHADDPRAVFYCVRACVLADGAAAAGVTDPVPHYRRLAELARLTGPHGQFGLPIYGAALYRAGRYEDSLHCFEALRELYSPRAWDLCFLAMSHHRLGHFEEARRCLAEAVHWIDEANRDHLDDLVGRSPTWGAWHERAEFPLLLREAEALVKRAPWDG